MKDWKKILKVIFAIISFFVSIIIGFWAMFLPPPGVIDSSILWFIAQLLLFTSTIIGIDYHVQYRKSE